MKVPEDVSLGYEIIYMSRNPHMAILATEGRQMPMLDIRLDCIELMALVLAGLCSCLLTTALVDVAFGRMHHLHAAALWIALRLARICANAKHCKSSIVFDTR